MLSRAYLPATGNQSEIEHVNMVQYLPIRPDRLQQLKTETASDESLQMLKTVIRDGWPEEKHNSKFAETKRVRDNDQGEATNGTNPNETSVPLQQNSESPPCFA